MKEIQLTKGQVALVDDKDYNHLNEWTWHTHGRPGKWYAARWDNSTGERRLIYMHRYLKKLKTGNKLQVDHRDGNTFNNQRKNLRVVTNQQNQFNRKPASNTGIVGVTQRASGNYLAYIRINRKSYNLGTHPTLEQAVRARQDGFERLFGRLPR